MKVTVTNKIKLENLPSGSGLEIVDDYIYIIGDDSPYLYCLDFNFKLLEKIELFSSNDFVTGRIPKKIKPDLECITKLEINNHKYLLTAGSGSTSAREKAFLIDLSNNYLIKEFSLAEIYQSLRTDPLITDNLTLNIEGLCSDQDNLYLFNRTTNSIIIYSLIEFISFISGDSKILPIPKIINLELQGIDNLRAGFSGADISDNKIFFTSSVEDTDDPVLDGTVHGSFCGYLDLDILNSDQSPKISQYTPIEEDNSIFTGKVESISIYKKISDTEFLALCVTDDDLGGSELLSISLVL